MERVFIAVLAGNNWVNTSIAELANHLPYLSAQPETPFRFAFHIESGVRGQELARNRICGKFLSTDADILVMIDNDMVLSSYESLRVLETPEYDVAGPMQMMFDPGIDEKTGQVDPIVKMCAFQYDKEGDGYRSFLPVSGGPTVVECDAVGGGLIAIRRHVLEDKRMLLGEGYDPPAYFRTLVHTNYERKRGNDIDFCRRARECGFTIKVNWSAPTGHLKQNDLAQMDLMAKQNLVRGFRAGEQSALRMADEQCRTAAGEARGAGSGRTGDEKLARVRLDRSRRERLRDAAGAGNS